MQELEAETVANGQNTPGVVVNGVADPLLLDDFYDANFPAIPATMATGSSGRDVLRLQRRLSLLEYYTGTLDGQYGMGTADAVMYFQKQHKLNRSGIADSRTLQVLFSENAQKALKPYQIKVSVADQKVYVYGLDDNNQYTDLVRTMKCSTGKQGTPTPTGTFVNSTGPGARWHYFKKFDCWAQYAYYIQGDIMFHSVPAGLRRAAPPAPASTPLRRSPPQGCVRLSVEDAKGGSGPLPQETPKSQYTEPRNVIHRVHESGTPSRLKGPVPRSPGE